MAEPTQLKVTQTRSGAGRSQQQIATLKGLGLNKIGRSRTWPNTRATRGRLRVVEHLIKVEAIEA